MDLDGLPLRLAWADWWADVANECEPSGDPDQETARRLYDAWVERLDREIVARDAAGNEYSVGGTTERPLMASLPRDAAEKRVTALAKKWISSAIAICWLVDRFSWAVRIPAPAHEILVGVDSDGRLVRRGTSSPVSHEDVRLFELLTPPRPLIFARCDNPKCRRIFARHGRAKRCSLKCTQRVHDAKRAGTPQRKAQVQTALERHRSSRSQAGPADSAAHVRPNRKKEE